jgi:CheY-like chemotaxis protein
MYNNDSLIFAVEDDIPYGKLILYCFEKHGYKNVIVYTHEKDCLDNFTRRPDILITDYRLKSMDGIKLIQKARKIYPDFYCILLSGMQQDEIFLPGISRCYIDKYIRKDLNSMQELILALDHYLHSQYVEQYC